MVCWIGGCGRAAFEIYLVKLNSDLDWKNIIMADLVYLSIILIFFAASWGFIIGCERLMEA